MKSSNTDTRSNLSIYALIVLVLIAPAASWAINKSVVVGKINGAEVAKSAPLPGATPPKPKRKRGKANQQPMTRTLAAVPVGVWGTHGIIVNVEENSVTIEYDCADGQIEQTLKMDPRGNFTANGIHSGRSGGPVLKDAHPARQGARYEGRISGDTMALKVTLIGTNEVIGEFKLQRGKIHKLTRCY